MLEDRSSQSNPGGQPPLSAGPAPGAWAVPGGASRNGTAARAWAISGIAGGCLFIGIFLCSLAFTAHLLTLHYDLQGAIIHIPVILVPGLLFGGAGWYWARGGLRRLDRLRGIQPGAPGAQDPAVRKARRGILIGGISLGAGLVVTLFTYSLASSSSNGGVYVVEWGPMLFGAFRIISGLVTLSRSRH